ncbi:unnamed protein product [Callosobruchus maculatus]|uniref:Calponin-homology (CH) domain-containing protein n=1 Tax=Callosobruchus maculatus TaxID=64391 RepID=A0A653C3K8_CALMS|nr:unnamed protein product [Callosobruchus maculatus]
MYKTKVNAKYSEELASECLQWINAITNDGHPTAGDMDNFYEVLKDGTVLCKNHIFCYINMSSACLVSRS